MWEGEAGIIYFLSLFSIILYHDVSSIVDWKINVLI